MESSKFFFVILASPPVVNPDIFEIGLYLKNNYERCDLEDSATIKDFWARINDEQPSLGVFLCSTGQKKKVLSKMFGKLYVMRNRRIFLRRKRKRSSGITPAMKRLRTK